MATRADLRVPLRRRLMVAADESSSVAGLGAISQEAVVNSMPGDAVAVPIAGRFASSCTQLVLTEAALVNYVPRVPAQGCSVYVARETEPSDAEPHVPYLRVGVGMARAVCKSKDKSKGKGKEKGKGCR